MIRKVWTQSEIDILSRMSSDSREQSTDKFTKQKRKMAHNNMSLEALKAHLFDQEFATYIKPQEDIHPQVKPRRTRQRAKDGTIEEVYETDYDYCEPVFSDDVPERYSEELL